MNKNNGDAMDSEPSLATAPATAPAPASTSTSTSTSTAPTSTSTAPTSATATATPMAAAMSATVEKAPATNGQSQQIGHEHDRPHSHENGTSNGQQAQHRSHRQHAHPHPHPHHDAQNHTHNIGNHRHTNDPSQHSPQQQHHQQHRQRQHQQQQHEQHQHQNEQQPQRAPREENELHSLSLAYQTYMRHNETETNHFGDVCKAYRQYATFAMNMWANQQYRVHALPEDQQRLLPRALKRDSAEFHARAKNWKEAVIRNQFLLDCILRHAGVPHSQQITTATAFVTDGQVSKVSSVLKSIARDWSNDATERNMAYAPLIEQVKRFIPQPQKSQRGPRPRICVPGAGVSRLAFDLAGLGYCVQGNEFSLHMLLASDFILNGGILNAEQPLSISPWLLESRNVHGPNDPCRQVYVPDIDPYSILSDVEEGEESIQFSMAAGEFLSIYSHPKEAGKWDAVVCCFFLDACPNVIEVIRLVHHMLRPGGVFINFGPLLYHWSGPAMRPDDKDFESYQSRFSFLDKRYMTSIDLCYEDIREIILNVGFEFVEEKTAMKCLYTADRRSMMNMVYHSVHFVAKKLQTSCNGE